MEKCYCWWLRRGNSTDGITAVSTAWKATCPPMARRDAAKRLNSLSTFASSPSAYLTALTFCVQHRIRQFMASLTSWWTDCSSCILFSVSGHFTWMCKLSKDVWLLALKKTNTKLSAQSVNAVCCVPQKWCHILVFLFSLLFYWVGIRFPVYSFLTDWKKLKTWGLFYVWNLWMCWERPWLFFCSVKSQSID